jgi:alpha-glucosidase (family GH31 glycosyl hydrolase)
VLSGYPVVQNYSYFDSDPHTNQLNFLRTTQLSVFQGNTVFAKGFWNIGDTNLEYALKFYLQLRNRLQQYAYDQAMTSYLTGKPMSMRPLFFDYPGDANVYTQYAQLASADGTDTNDPRDEYMFGNALLVRPVFSDSNTVKVYLPGGRWRPFLQANQPALSGNQYIDYTIASAYDYPVFIKQGEILIIGEATNFKTLDAYVFLDTINHSNTYTYHDGAGQTVQLTANKDAGGNVTITNGSQTIPMVNDEFGKGLKVAAINSLLPPKTGDADQDYDVDWRDYAITLSHFNQNTTRGFLDGDFNLNGRVDLFDIGNLISMYRR